MNTLRSLIVVPTYNERENLPLLLEAVLKVVPAEVEILVVAQRQQRRRNVW